MQVSQYSPIRIGALKGRREMPTRRSLSCFMPREYFVNPSRQFDIPNFELCASTGGAGIVRTWLRSGTSSRLSSPPEPRSMPRCSRRISRRKYCIIPDLTASRVAQQATAKEVVIAKADAAGDASRSGATYDVKGFPTLVRISAKGYYKYQARHARLHSRHGNEFI